MQDSTMAVLTLYGVLSIALFVLWLKHKSVLKQREKMMSRLGSVKGNLSETTQKLDLLSRGVDTILSDSPQVQNLLGVHRSLESAESLLFNQGIPISNSESCAIATHAVKSLLQHYVSSDEGIEITPGLKPLTKRLAAILTEAEMKAEDVEISADEHRRMGELFHSIDRGDWAADCFRRANELDPEDELALRSLVDIQRSRGDLEALDRSLERLLAISPDEIEILREQTILLEGTDPKRVRRNRKRMEGLGIEQISDENKHLAEITERAKESNIGQPPQKEIEDASKLVSRANKQLLLGEAHIALETIDLALEIDSNSGPAWLLKSTLLASSKQSTKEALKCIRRANALGEYTIIHESEILENDDRTDAAIEVLEEHIESNPSDSEALGKLSLLWLSRGAIDSSRKVLDEAPEKSWDNSALHIMRGRLHLFDAEVARDNTGSIDQMSIIEAIVSYDRAIEIDRESGLAWLGRARALRFQGTLDESEVALVRARRLIPDNLSIPLEEAQLSLAMGNLEQANASALEATTNLKNDPTVPFIRGIISARHGRLKEAGEFFTQTLDIDEKHVRARLNRCSAALLCDDLTLALDDANHLVSNKPNHEIARLRRSEVLMNHSDWKEAESELRELLRRNPNHSMALIHLGTCMIAMEKPEQAERPLNKAIEIDPTLSEAWYQRGLLYLEFGRIEEAVSDFEGAIRVNPQHLDALLRIAAILHEAGDQKKASSAWRKVLDISPQHGLARRRLSECREKLMAESKAIHPKD